jgi:hypothetical protein
MVEGVNNRIDYLISLEEEMKKYLILSQDTICL